MNNNFYLQLGGNLLIALIITLILCPLMIPMLHRFKFGQPIRGEGPKSHQKKAGTPTMGGISFMIAILVVMIINFKSFTDPVMIPVYSMFAFGMIGLLDDSIKIIKKDNEGLKAYQKMTAIVVVSLLIGILAANVIGTELIIPFYSKTLDIGFIPYVLGSIVYFAAVTNSVNLTDGLDGLATSVTLVVVMFFSVAGVIFKQFDIVIFTGIVIGALLGFLKSNAYPAKIFMGDTGSLALGGVVAGIGLILKMPIFVIIVGGIYVYEALSVIIQVVYYKKTKKRFFKMAPVHHHYEAMGWSEVKVVTVFASISAVLAIIGIISLYLVI